MIFEEQKFHSNITVRCLLRIYNLATTFMLRDRGGCWEFTRIRYTFERLWNNVTSSKLFTMKSNNYDAYFQPTKSGELSLKGYMYIYIFFFVYVLCILRIHKTHTHTHIYLYCFGILYSFIYLAENFVKTSPRPKISRYVCFCARNRHSKLYYISFRPRTQ